MNQVIQGNGTVTYYAAKVNGQIKGGLYLTEQQALDHYVTGGIQENMTIVPCTSNGQEILLG